jgi:ATP-dependent Clp protease ATP-binding subunit ClpC
MKGEGLASDVLTGLGVSYEVVRAKVAEDVEPGLDAGHARKVPFSTHSKKALELSLREALRLHHNYIGTEHLLLGVLRESGPDSSKIQALIGVEVDEVKARVIQLISSLPLSSLQTLGSVSSPAVIASVQRARQAAGESNVTTGHLISAIVSDENSHATKALKILGVNSEEVTRALSEVQIEDTSDATPRPRTVEIRFGEVSAKIEDPDLVDALSKLTPDQIKERLGAAFGEGGKRTRRSR